MRTIRIPETAYHELLGAAEANNVTLQQYLEALLHYGLSCHNRPGSWEASRPFHLHTYTDPDSAADRWF